MGRKITNFPVIAVIGWFLLCPLTGFAARDGGYDITSDLWAKAVLQVSGSPVTLKWKVAGTDITPSGDQVISGYFYADPNDFAYGSEYNPEVFVKIYITESGWCNIIFSHVTVDNVGIYSAHNYAGSANQSGTASLNSRLVEHQYDGVKINDRRLSRIPDTGQTTSYTDTFGEDSDYTINAQSYTKLDAFGNTLSDSASQWAMIRDNVTELIWENKIDDGSLHDKDNTYFWQNAKDDFIAQLNIDHFGGHSDWRLPTAHELSTLGNAERWDPAINTAYFQNTMPAGYWSSTAGDDRWTTLLVYFYYCGIASGYNGIYGGYVDSLYVRAVCGGQHSGLWQMVDNHDGTVTDTATGLMWQKDEAGEMDWTTALTYCENLQLATHDDWRLPNRNELQSIVDYTYSNPAIDRALFPEAKPSIYWSSTTKADDPEFAWYVNFSDGYIFGKHDKTNNYYVRAVRGGQ
jgi:hypothetical protein